MTGSERAEKKKENGRMTNENGKRESWKMEDGRWKKENGRRTNANGEWKMKVEKCKMAEVQRV